MTPQYNLRDLLSTYNEINKNIQIWKDNHDPYIQAKVRNLRELSDTVAKTYKNLLDEVNNLINGALNSHA